jgi:DNA-binding GntR family transcriptional regulator
MPGPLQARPGSARAPLTRRILADDVYEMLTALIMDHELPPDAKVGIDQLARELDVSQTPIREALARLEADGLVRKEALRGYFTTPLLTRAQLDELFEFRRLLEPWAARNAAERLGQADEGALHRELAEAPAIPDGADYDSYKSLTEHDTRFHRLVFELARNESVADSFERTHCHLHLFRLHYGAPMAGSAIAEHELIARAIEQRDPDAAHDAMLSHLDKSYSRLEQAAR